MIRREYTDEEKQTFHHLRFHHPEPRVRDRFEVLWLHAHQKSFPEIAVLAKVSEASARKYFRLYEKGGIALVEAIDAYRPKSAFEKHREEIIGDFKKRPPASSKEAAARIKNLTGVDRKPRAVENFMKSIGMKFRKVGAVPGKADPDVQEEFKKKFWSLK